MKQIVSNQERNRLDARVAETEQCTSTQIVLGVIRRSDVYAELPWKAFAFGASSAGLILLLLFWRFHDRYPDVSALAMVAGMLASGALPALLSVMMPRFARCFLAGYRAEAEVQQYAQSLFLERELFATGNRRGILLLVSLFERRVVVLPDRGLDARLTAEHKRAMIEAMTPFLKHRQIGKAFDAGLDALSRILTTPSRETRRNELSDRMIEEEGV